MDRRIFMLFREFHGPVVGGDIILCVSVGIFKGVQMSMLYTVLGPMNMGQ